MERKSIRSLNCFVRLPLAGVGALAVVPASNLSIERTILPIASRDNLIPRYVLSGYDCTLISPNSFLSLIPDTVCILSVLLVARISSAGVHMVSRASFLVSFQMQVSLGVFLKTSF